MAKRVSRKSKTATPKTLSSTMMDKLTALDNQRRAIMEGAKKEALSAAHAAIAALNSLGLNYALAKAGKRPRAGQRTRTIKDAPCMICGFRTSPPHDRRAHRSQKNKKPFTSAELKTKGLTKA